MRMVVAWALVILGLVTCSACSPGAPVPPSSEEGEALGPEQPTLAFGQTHFFPDGNAVTLAPPSVGGSLPGAPPSARTATMLVTVRNGTAAPEDISRFEFDAMSGDQEASQLALDEEPEEPLLPGQSVEFPITFALPATGFSIFEVQVSKADLDATGEGIPGSDELPGAAVTYETMV